MSTARGMMKLAGQLYQVGKNVRNKRMSRGKRVMLPSPSYGKGWARNPGKGIRGMRKAVHGAYNAAGSAAAFANGTGLIKSVPAALYTKSTIQNKRNDTAIGTETAMNLSIDDNDTIAAGVNKIQVQPLNTTWFKFLSIKASQWSNYEFKGLSLSYMPSCATSYSGFVFVGAVATYDQYKKIMDNCSTVTEVIEQMKTMGIYSQCQAFDQMKFDVAKLLSKNLAGNKGGWILKTPADYDEEDVGSINYTQGYVIYGVYGGTAAQSGEICGTLTMGYTCALRNPLADQNVAETTACYTGTSSDVIAPLLHVNPWLDVEDGDGDELVVSAQTRRPFIITLSANSPTNAEITVSDSTYCTFTVIRGGAIATTTEYIVEGYVQPTSSLNLPKFTVLFPNTATAVNIVAHHVTSDVAKLYVKGK